MLTGFVPDRGEPGLLYESVNVLVRSSRRRPAAVLLRRTPPIAQQHQDCVATSASDAYLFELLSEGLVTDRDVAENYDAWLPSRRKLYWDARAVLGMERRDEGTMPSALVEAIGEKGVCAERWCPYGGSPVENPLADYDNAGRMSLDQAGKIELYLCPDADAVLDAIVMGHRVLYAARIYEDFADVGAPSEEGQAWALYQGASDNPLGLHMFQIVGYQANGAMFVAKNQWLDWGNENQEGLIPRRVLERDRFAALAFRRVARFSEGARA